MRLDTSTTLIGENGCGIGSLLAALELALGRDEDARLSAADVHRPDGRTASGEAVVIRLVFGERTDGEWNGAPHDAIGAYLPAQVGPRQIDLELSAAPPAEGHVTPLRARVAGVRDGAATHAIVRHLRTMTPVLRITAGALTRHSMASEAAMADSTTSPAVATLVRPILAAADELLSGTAPDPERCIEAGAAAAGEFLAMRPHHVDPVRAGLAHPILEILGIDTKAAGPGPPAEAPGTRRAAHRPAAIADRLGMLLLLAAILRRVPDGLAAGAEPLWIVEDPEAHLHPMTLASLHGVLGRIRWQKIVTTQSGDLLAAVPLAQVRRLVREDGVVHSSSVAPRTLSRDHLRRVGYHLRVHRGVAMFARVWLLVEGESEHWILPQVAQVLGYNLAVEGICCVGFAQCGLEPLVRTAHAFGIEWHLLADGDEAGRHYVEAARTFVRHGDVGDRITALDEPDIEHCFWRHGHAATIAAMAGVPTDVHRSSARQTIARAVKRQSKPLLALKLVEAVAARGPVGVPAPLAALVETCVRLSRDAPRRAAQADRARSTKPRPR